MEYPESYKNLKYRHRLFIDCFLSETLIEPQTHKNTFNNKFVSFIFANNVDIDDFLGFKYYKLNFATKSFEQIEYYCEGCDVNIVIKNAKKYMSIISNSTKMYNKCIQAINDIRMLQYNSDDNSKVLELKDAIFNSSINSNDFKDRNDNRKMAMKMFGLDQIKLDLTADIYEASGKQILGSRLNSKDMDRDDAPIIPDILENVDISDKEEDD